MDFAKHIKRARKSSGLTQKELATASGVSRSAVIDLEAGRGSMTSLTFISNAIDFRITGLGRGRTFGHQVKNRRTKLKWSQHKLATKTGLTVATIRAVENNTANLNSFTPVLDFIAKKSKPRKSEKAYWRNGNRDVRHTPPKIVTAIKECFGDIHCDPCHDENSHVEPAVLGITEQMDGLITQWKGEIAFVNPPYSNLPVWLERITRALEQKEVRTVIAMLPFRSETIAFQDHVLTKAELLFPRGRVRFYANGKQLGQAPFGIVFAIFNASQSQISHFARTINAIWMKKN